MFIGFRVLIRDSSKVVPKWTRNPALQSHASLALSPNGGGNDRASWCQSSGTPQSGDNRFVARYGIVWWSWWRRRRRANQSGSSAHAVADSSADVIDRSFNEGERLGNRTDN